VVGRKEAARVARRRARRGNQRAKTRRPGLAWTLVSTGLLAATGFAVGLLVGAVWETPEKILPLLSGDGERISFANLAAPGGDTTPPPDERDAGVPERDVAPPAPAGEEPPPVAAPPPARGPFAIQVGSFTEPVPAWKLAEQLGDKQYEVYVDEGDAAGQPRWRVRIGPVTSRRAARGLAERLKAEEGLPTWILPAGKG
jgi:hypothetical protein